MCGSQQPKKKRRIAILLGYSHGQQGKKTTLKVNNKMQLHLVMIAKQKGLTKLKRQ